MTDIAMVRLRSRDKDSTPSTRHSFKRIIIIIIIVVVVIHFSHCLNILRCGLNTVYKLFSLSPKTFYL